MVEEAGGRDAPSVRGTVQKLLPVDVRADVDRITVGKTSCAIYDPSEGCGRYEVVVPKANECPLWAVDPANPDADPAEKFTKAERRKLAEDWRCQESQVGSITDGGVVIGDAKLLTVLGIEDPAAAKALADGQVLSFDKRNVDGSGKIGIRVVTDVEAADRAAEEGKETPGEVKRLAAHQVAGSPNSYGVEMIMPAATAKASAFTTVPIGSYFSTSKMPTSEQRQKLDGELDKVGSSVDLHIEEGYTSENNIILLALTVFAGLVTIGAAGIATGLAQADAEADLKTLAAVGAPPRVRRTLSGFQCGVVAAMGVVLGSAAGVLPAIGLRLTEQRQEMSWYQRAMDEGWGGMGEAPYVPIIVPWATLAALLVAVPLGAALLAALVTRSRGALARREAT